MNNPYKPSESFDVECSPNSGGAPHTLLVDKMNGTAYAVAVDSL